MSILPFLLLLLLSHASSSFPGPRTTTTAKHRNATLSTLPIKINKATIFDPPITRENSSNETSSATRESQLRGAASQFPICVDVLLTVANAALVVAAIVVALRKKPKKSSEKSRGDGQSPVGNPEAAEGDMNPSGADASISPTVTGRKRL
ncbi:hypothetical protein L596_018021 [Steinernema carpocapsae]|uniref:Transmembrane protein n=1 Tax=Steinernema carpocapsae TaxID=34508 RepID=A0A4U5N3V6_STECR|nr:hypothetical protein L596_018021 [Steinernema carpocapsae]